MPKSDRYGDVLLLDYTDERSNRAIKKKRKSYTFTYSYSYT